MDKDKHHQNEYELINLQKAILCDASVIWTHAYSRWNIEYLKKKQILSFV